MTNRQDSGCSSAHQDLQSAPSLEERLAENTERPRGAAGESDDADDIEHLDDDVDADDELDEEDAEDDDDDDDNEGVLSSHKP